MKKYLTTAFILLLVSFVCNAQTPTVDIDEADINRFIKTYKPMTQEFEDLGEEYDDVDMTTMSVMAANEKVKSILEKYGWDEEMSMKWMAITMAYTLVKMDEELAGMSAEERAQFGAVMGSNPFGTVDVSEEDKKMVKARISELDEIFDNDE